MKIVLFDDVPGLRGSKDTPSLTLPVVFSSMDPLVEQEMSLKIDPGHVHEKICDRYGARGYLGMVNDTTLRKYRGKCPVHVSQKNT